MDNILLIRLSAIGDICCMYSSLVELKRKFPDSKIDILSRPKNNEVITWINEINEHIAIEDKIVKGNVLNVKKGKDSNFIGIVRLVYRLRKQKYDYIFIFQKSFRANILAFLIKAKKEIIGYDLGNGIKNKIMTRVVYVSEDVAEYKKHNMIVGCDINVFHKGLQPKGKSRFSLNKDKPNILINPFANWETRTLSSEVLIELIVKLKERYNCNIYLLGAESNIEFVTKFLGEIQDLYISYVGCTSLTDVYFLINQADYFVCVDSGPLHIAQHTDCKIISIYGPTNPARVGYLDMHNNYCIVSENKCNFCEKSKCLYEQQCIKSDIIPNVVKIIGETYEKSI